VTIALAIFVALAPGLAIIALLIKLTSPGPVLFWQDRYGLNGRFSRSPSSARCSSMRLITRVFGKRRPMMTA
jgi:O-antigen biosynthesis protein WbqP